MRNQALPNQTVYERMFRAARPETNRCGHPRTTFPVKSLGSGGVGLGATTPGIYRSLVSALGAAMKTPPAGANIECKPHLEDRIFVVRKLDQTPGWREGCARGIHTRPRAHPTNIATPIFARASGACNLIATTAIVYARSLRQNSNHASEAKYA